MSLTVPTSTEFPVLAREGLVYLDTAATSQTVRAAIEAMDRYYETYRASIHRGAYAWGRANAGPDDLVLVTQMEHHSNIVPWQLLGSRLDYVPVTSDGL